jgi:hypothetical protein
MDDRNTTIVYLPVAKRNLWNDTAAYNGTESVSLCALRLYCNILSSPFEHRTGFGTDASQCSTVLIFNALQNHVFEIQMIPAAIHPTTAK